MPRGAPAAGDTQMFEHVVVSSRGVAVENNEDWAESNKREGLYALCDGMSAHAGGEVAAQVAGAAIEEFVVGTRSGKIKTLPYPFDPALSREANRLRMAMRVANGAVRTRASEEPNLAGMGASAVALLGTEHIVIIASAGDCRVYRLRDARLRQLVPDSPAATPLGLVDVPTVLLSHHEVDDGDVLMLCTGGLYRDVSERKMESLFEESIDLNTRSLDLQRAAQELARQPSRHNPSSDATVVLLRPT
jgi:protein phosphatase